MQNLENLWLVSGRVWGGEENTHIVEASNQDSANALFTAQLQNDEGDNESPEVFIILSMPLSKAVENRLKKEPNSSGLTEFVDGSYVSEWEEGIVHTDCTIDTTDFSVTVATVDSDYEHLECEYIEITVNGKKVQLDVENGELTEKGKSDLQAIYNVCAR